MMWANSVYFSCNALCVVIYPPSQRKQQKDLLAALQKVVVPIYCTSFLAVEEEKQQKITRVNICTLKAQSVWIWTEAAKRLCVHVHFLTSLKTV